MANKKYFQFISDVWDLLSDEDKTTLGELWHGYEQVVSSYYQQFVENDLNVSVNDLQQYHTERWLKYTFNDENLILRPPIYTSTQDLSQGLNLTNRFLLKFSINDGKPFEVDCRGRFSAKTSIDEIVLRINIAAGFEFARTIFSNSIIQLVSNKVGASSNIKILKPSSEERDATEYILGLQWKDLPLRYPEFPWVYSLPYDKIVSIPDFRTAIRDETDKDILNEGVDYKIESNNLISFKDIPYELMWAKKTMIDHEDPWHNFGFLMGIYQKNKPSYMSVIKGLWYAFWTGPRPDTVQRSLYLLFGLPVAPCDGTVTYITESVIEITDSNGVIYPFDIPAELKSIVYVGQTVSIYDPLVNGIEVYDKVSYPGFIESEIGRVGIQRFLTPDATRGPGDTDETKALSLLEDYTFLPQISVESFISPDINMGNVKLFLQNIKPLVSTFLFQVVVGAFSEKMDIKEKIGMDISMDITPNLDSNQTTFAEKALLNNYEISEVPGLNLDSEVIAGHDSLAVEVYRKGILVEQFDA